MIIRLIVAGENVIDLSLKLNAFRLTTLLSWLNLKQKLPKVLSEFSFNRCVDRGTGTDNEVER